MNLAQLTLPNEVPISNSPAGGFTINNPTGFGSGVGGTLGSPGEILTKVAPYAMVLGGLILFGMLIIGGFEMLTSVGNQEKMAAGGTRIKNALIGFLLLFAVFWLAQIMQIIFKVQIL